MNYIIQLEILS